MIYALPEIRSDALARAYVSDILGRPFSMVSVRYAKQRAVDEVKSGRLMVKVARRVT